jgi:hypothetical protein
MISRSRMFRRPVPVAALVATTLSLGIGVAALPSAQAAPHDPAAGGGRSQARPAPVARTQSDKGFYDSRQGSSTAQRAVLSGRAAQASSRQQTEAL